MSIKGTVKELKERLKIKLRPSSKLETRPVKSDPELSRHLNKKCIMSKPVQESGRIEHLLIVDNKAEKIVSLELEYKEGEVFANIKETANFPVGVKDIKVSVHTKNNTLLFSDDQLTVLNESFQLLGQMNLHDPIIDACSDGRDLFFVQSHRVWSESLDNLRKSIFNPKCIAGSGKTIDKDGSGLSSSFGLLACISKYQNSILVGT